MIITDITIIYSQRMDMLLMVWNNILRENKKPCHINCLRFLCIYLTVLATHEKVRQYLLCSLVSLRNWMVSLWNQWFTFLVIQNLLCLGEWGRCFYVYVWRRVIHVWNACVSSGFSLLWDYHIYQISGATMAPLGATAGDGSISTLEIYDTLGPRPFVLGKQREV